MELNTTTALLTAVISAGIGFGLAFYLERQINASMQTKFQKTLVTIAMISFGYGLMATLNEVIGFPLQGLQIRYDKLAGYVLVNILLLPIALLAITKLIGLNNKAIKVDSHTNSNLFAAGSFKFYLVLAGALSVAFLGYQLLQEKATPEGETFDFYYRKNCAFSFEPKASYSKKFLFKKETGEIFMTVERDFDGVKKQAIQKLENCSVLNSKNWTCGGKWISGPLFKERYQFVDGNFSYNNGILDMCHIKIVKN